MIGQTQTYQNPQMGMGYGNGNYGQGVPGYGTFNPNPQGTGYQFNGAPVAAVKVDNNLTQDEIQQLVKKEAQFTIALSETEKLKGICNHRTADGMRDALNEDPNTGECTCRICGYTFTPSFIASDDNAGMEELWATVHALQNYLQTIKLIYPDMPKEAQRSFFVLIPLLDKIPGLYNLAVKSYIKREGGNYYTYSGHGMPVLAQFRQIIGSVGPMGAGINPYFSYGQNNGWNQVPFDPNTMGSPYAGYPQNPQMYAQNPTFVPTQNPQGNYAPQSNGFGYNAPVMGNPQQDQNNQFVPTQNPQMYAQNPQGGGYNPQTTGFAYQPTQSSPNVPNTIPTQPGQSATHPMQTQPMQAQQSAPGSIAPESQKTTTDGNTTNVTAKFNA